MAKEKTRIKKKKWIQIVAPGSFKEAILGETSVLETSTVMGKTIKANLMDLTGNIKKQNTEVMFRVIKVVDNKATAEPVSIKIAHSSIKRFVRRGKDKVEDSFICKTSDEKNVRIKPFLITRSKVKNSILITLRRKAKELITKGAEKLSFDNFINEIISNKFQINISNELKTIYPLRAVHIKEAKLVVDKKYKQKSTEKVEKPIEKKETPKKEEPKKEEVKKEPIEEKTPKKEEPKKQTENNIEKNEKGDNNAKSNS